MKCNLLAVTVLAALAGAANAQQSAGGTAIAHLTDSQAKRMEREARTSEQYGALQSYYKAKQAAYLQRAAVEKREWESRSAGVPQRAAKYPRPLDSSRNRYEYLMAMAQRAGARADRWARAEDREEQGQAQ